MSEYLVKAVESRHLESMLIELEQIGTDVRGLSGLGQIKLSHCFLV